MEATVNQHLKTPPIPIPLMEIQRWEDDGGRTVSIVAVPLFAMTSSSQPQVSPMFRNSTASHGTQTVATEPGSARPKSLRTQRRGVTWIPNSATIGPGRFQAVRTLGLGALLVAMIVLAMVLYSLKAQPRSGGPEAADRSVDVRLKSDEVPPL